MADHEAEARKLLRSFYGRTQAEEEAMVAAALLAAERRGIERAADEAEDFLVRIGAGWRKFSHNSSDGKARERMCVERIRSLLSPAAPAPKCGTCPNGLLPDGETCPRCGGKRAPSGVGGGTWVHFDPEKCRRGDKGCGETLCACGSVTP